jgi:hypothetical protein
MVGTSQVETRSAFEPRSAPVEPTPGGISDAGRANRTGLQDIGGRDSSGPSEASSSGQSDHAFSIQLSAAAQKFSANDNTGQDTAPQAPDSDSSRKPDTTGNSPAADTSAADHSIRSDDAGSRTNQFTSFESERTGNDTHNTTEAGRTLGQVIDTFA